MLSLCVGVAIAFAPCTPGRAGSLTRVPQTHRMGLFDFLGTGDTNTQQGTPPGMASVSHILLTGPSASEDAMSLRTRIDDGDLSFDDAARQYSVCRSSGQGGNLGAFRGPTQKLPLGLGRVWNLPYEGKEVPEFDSLVFSQETALDTIHICNTAFGVHLVVVQARGPPES